MKVIIIMTTPVYVTTHVTLNSAEECNVCYCSSCNRIHVFTSTYNLFFPEKEHIEKLAAKLGRVKRSITEKYKK